MNKICVLLADDHIVARAGIRNFINKDLEIEVIGEADNGETPLQLVIELKPDVLLLDMEMPGLKGIDVAKELKEINSPVKILLLSSYNDKQLGVVDGKTNQEIGRALGISPKTVE